jgi:hypothetical protein
MGTFLISPSIRGRPSEVAEMRNVPISQNQL